MSQHTPGPWRMIRNDAKAAANSPRQPLNTYNIVTDHNGGQATVYGVHYEANARLIAAAPDILEALLMMKKRWHDNANPSLDDFKVVQAALSKAGAL